MNGRQPADVFMTAASPGLIAMFLAHEYYQGEEEYLYALADAMKPELPAGKVLIPGVIDSETNIVEHLELVAQRIIGYADAVGRENVIAGTDCGFGTLAGNDKVHPRITWLKLRALADEALIASGQLW